MLVSAYPAFNNGQSRDLDTSVYNRPFDDQTQPRIWLETLAFALILQMIEIENTQLVTSSVLEYENDQNPFELRRRWVTRCTRLASFHREVDEDIRQRGEALEQQGLRAIDALHVACAEAAGSEYFMTCDDRLIRHYQNDKLEIMNPADFVVRIGGER
jgi:predicted nucleic acid-binding protein